MKAKFLYLGTPKSYRWQGKEVLTSIFRDRVTELEIKNKSILENEQADPIFHGGKYKEVYSYALEDYKYWEGVFGKDKTEIGFMGESITTIGLDEDNVCIGDRFKIGSVVLEVTQPRRPCFKLNLRLNRKDGVKLFLDSNKFGLYFKLIEDGIINEGDEIVSLGRDKSYPVIKFSEIIPVIFKRKISQDLYERIKSFPDIDPVILKCAEGAAKF